MYSNNNHWMNMLQIDSEVYGTDREMLMQQLATNNIQTRPIFSGNILRHPAFKNIINKKNRLNSFKNADYVMKNGILIGCHQGLSKKNINYIHTKIYKLINR